MTQILINASAIWLGSLLAYELLLKRITFHRLNRAFLLLTFIAGGVLPLLPWGNTVALRSYAPNAVKAAAATNDAAAAGLAEAERGAEPATDWLLIAYLTGAALALLIPAFELRRLVRLYRRAQVTAVNGWRIAETGSDHQPFSLLNIVFVGSRGHYTTEQWNMIMQHEQQHFRSRHFLDLALLQLACVLCWFHPLVYVYRNRLRLLHEYEVDSLQPADIRDYGRFLLEQVTGRPLAMTHSFNFSPIKSRIHMLTKKTSSPLAKARYLLVIPMMSCFIWACTRNRPTVEVDIRDRHVMRHDAALTFPVPAPSDTIVMTDTESGREQTMVMTIDPVPSKLNNREILRSEALGLTPHCLNPGETFGMTYLLKTAGLEGTLQKMLDGEYYMAVSDIIVDPSGHVAYFMTTLPENRSGMRTDAAGINYAASNGLSPADNEIIQRKLAQVLIGGDVAFTTVKDAKGTAAPYFLDQAQKESAYPLGTTFFVKDHKLSFR